MKQLILFRHAKSSWNLPVHDLERDLLSIGIERTHASAKYLKSILTNNPQKWWTSPAQRALKTAEIASIYFDVKPSQIEINDSLYTFSFFDLLKAVKKLPNEFESAIIFGHNEAFTEFVNRMGDQYIENLPTSGIAIINFDAQSWNQIQKGKTKKIIKPKDLK